MLCVERSRSAIASTLSVDDVLSNTRFEEVRPRLRPLVSELRRRRRHRLEPHCTVAFENRETVLWQIQEVLRVEGRTDPMHIAEEVARYDALLPRAGELRATIFIDGGPQEEAAELCARLASDSKSLQLRVGSARCFAECVEVGPEPSSPVRYVRFPLREAGVRERDFAEWPSTLLLSGTLTAASPLPRGTRRALAHDLRVAAEL